MTNMSRELVVLQLASREIMSLRPHESSVIRRPCSRIFPVQALYYREHAQDPKPLKSEERLGPCSLTDHWTLR